MNMQLTLALRYLAGRRLRTVLTTLAIAFGVLVIYGLNSIMPAFLGAFQANAMAMAGQVDAAITSATGGTFPVSTVEQVAAVDGVQTLAGTLERSVGLQADYFDNDPAMPDRVTAMTLVGGDPDAMRSVAATLVEEGRFLAASDTNAAVIARSLAEVAGVGVGDTLRLPATQGLANLTVVGVLPQRLLPGNEEVLVTLSDAQRLLAMPDQINVIEVNFDSVEEARRAQIEQAIRALLGPGFTIGVLQPGSEILNNIQIGQQIMSLMGVLGLLMGGFIILNTFRTIVAERRRDIGMLRAVGASRRTVTGLILVESLVLGAAGSVIGLVLGYGLAALVTAAVAPVMRQFLNIQIAAPGLQPGLALAAIIGGVGVTLLASLLPARAASRVAPLEALRPQIGAKALRRLTGVSFWAGVVMIVLAVAALLIGNAGLLSLGSLLFIAGLLLVAPALVVPIANLFGRLAALLFAADGTAQLAEGNLARQPSRAALTASTTMIGLAILVMAAGLLSSVAITFQRMLDASLGSDYLLVPPSVATWGLSVGANPELAEDLRAVEGVEVLSTMRFAATQVAGQAISMLGVDPLAYQATSGLTFIKGDPATTFEQVGAGRAMIINGLLASAAGVQIGDTLDVPTAGGAAAYTVAGIASDYLNAKLPTAYISQANIAADFGRAEDVFYQINLKDGADAAAVEAAFKQLLQPYPQFKLVAGQAYIDQNMALFNSMFVGMYAMLIFLAIPSLIAMVNTLAIGVIERRREIGMLRAVGATRRQVRRVILVEALILAAIGVAFGLLAGLYLGYMAASALSAFGFPMDYVFPASALLVAVAAGLLFGVLAALIPARQAAGLPIVLALRYE
jgi:putative ABC transport system permease protein